MNASDETIRLEAREVTLRIEAGTIGAADWCQVNLQLHDRVVPLGADSRKTIVARLLIGLASTLEGTPAGTFGQLPVHWVLSLSELHCAVYAADVETGRRLLFQDRDAKWIAIVTLSRAERIRWLALLNAT